MLNSSGRILPGFNGATIVTLGDVALPVKVVSVTQQVLFSIVEDFEPFKQLAGLTAMLSTIYTRIARKEEL